MLEATSDHAWVAAMLQVEAALAALPTFTPLLPPGLRAARKAAHLTQAGLAAALGLTEGAVARWEQVGVPRDRACTVRKLLAAAI